MRRFAGVLGLAFAGACGPAAGPDLRASITLDSLAEVTTPLMLVELPVLGTQATVIPWEQRAGVTVWRTPDFVSLAVQDGVVVATRGLGNDLMAADASGTLAALRGRAGPYDREAGTLDGEGRPVVDRMRCDMGPAVRQRIDIFGTAHDTRRIEERCEGRAGAVTNIYWLGPDGVMWRSRQWLGEVLGYVEMERLVE